MELQEFFERIKSEMYRSNKDRKHPFRLCTLATISTFPEQRTIVKRETTESLTCYFYTDVRSFKIDQIKNNLNCSLHFYHSKKKMQVVIKAEGIILLEGELFEKHKQIALLNPGDYSSALPPGSKIDLKEYETTTQTHFCLLQFKPISVQALQLSKDGHARAEWLEKDGWSGTWMVP